MENKLKMNTWKCDACADAEGGSGLPCTLTSPLLNGMTDLICPVSGEECQFEIVEDQRPAQPDHISQTGEQVVEEAEAYIIKWGTCEAMLKQEPVNMGDFVEGRVIITSLIAALKAANEEIGLLKAPWISVEEPPKYNDKFLVIYTNGNRGYAYYSHTEKIWYDNGERDVKLWTTFPELPKDGER